MKTRLQHLIARSVLGLAVTALVLGAVEAFLAVVGVAPLNLVRDPYVGFSGRHPLFVEERGEDGVFMVTAENKLDYFNRQRFPKNKPAGTTRVFCLGGSTTFGRPYDDRTSFCGWLRSFLREADRDGRWELINAGGISYAGYRVAVLLEELLRYDPDVIILYTGHNEFLEARTYGSTLSSPSLLQRLRALAGHSRLYTVMFRLLAPVGPDGGSKPAADSNPAPPRDGRDLLPAEVQERLNRSVGPEDYYRDDRFAARVLAHYRHNIERMTRMARAAGVRILLVAPASNLRDCAPFKSEHRDGITPEALRRWHADLATGKAALAAERHANALAGFDRAAAIDDRYAELHYLRGRALDGLERPEQARQAYVRARDEDICPLRALTPMREIVTDVARECDVPLVDFAALAARESADGIPGANLFLDHVHPTIEGNRLLALAILAAMRDRCWLNPAATWDEAAVTRVTQAKTAALDKRAHGLALRNLARVLGWAGKLEEAARLAERALALAPNEPLVTYQAGHVRMLRSEWDAALPLLRHAALRSPEYPEPHLDLGRVLSELGRLEEAVQSFRTAARLKPDSADAHERLGLTLHRLGRVNPAATAYRRALALDDGLPEAHGNLGLIAFQQGDLDSASRHLQRALELRPDYPEACYNTGLLLAARQDNTGASAQYERAIRLRPHYAEAHNNLAVIRAQQGRLREAVAHLEAAVNARPDWSEARANLHKVRVLLARQRETAQPDAE